MEDLLMQIEGEETLSMYKIPIINYIEKKLSTSKGKQLT